MKPEFSRQISEKSSNIKLHKNLYRESRVFFMPLDRRTDIIMKLVVALRNVANTLKNGTVTRTVITEREKVTCNYSTLLLH